nr:hypothetical protein CFP56_72498 [Quercus suber]
MLQWKPEMRYTARQLLDRSVASGVTRNCDIFPTTTITRHSTARIGVVPVEMATSVLLIQVGSLSHRQRSMHEATILRASQDDRLICSELYLESCASSPHARG